MEINVNNEEISSLAIKLYDCTEQLENEIKKIRNTVSNISNAWSGNDATKYINVMQEKYILGLEELKEKLTDYAVFLNNIPGAYDLLDNTYTYEHIG